MRFNISSTTLCSRLQTLSRVISSKNSIQILDCILFELNDGQLKLTASDGEVTLTTNLEVAESNGNGQFALQATQIINGLKEISDQPIAITIDENTYAVDIKYQNGGSKFIGQNGIEYPTPQNMNDDMQSITINPDSLLRGLSSTIFATAEDELRPVMNGVFFDIATDSITFVASDGHKLVRNRNLSVTTSNPTSFILPKKPAKILKDIITKDAEEAIIKFDDSYSEINLGNYSLCCRLIEGRYPNYNSVIPYDNPCEINVDRQTLIGALRRVLVFGSTSTSLIKLHIEPNTLIVSAQDIDFSKSATESIMCDYDGAPMSIGFKGTFLIDILNTINSQEVILKLADPSRAGVILPYEQEENEDLLMLLMPMMLND